jgi:hypothetical protein
LRDQAVTRPTDAIDIDVSCRRYSRPPLKFGTGRRPGEFERYGFGVG